MGGNGTFAAGKIVAYKWETVGKIGNVKILEPILPEGQKRVSHKLPEESHSSRMYILQYGDGNFAQLRIYDSFHRLRFELGYHREPRLDNTGKPILHYHTYVYHRGRSLFDRSEAKPVTEKMWRKFKQYMKGVEYK